MPIILLQGQPPANLPFLFTAFALTWLVFFAYAFLISRRRQELERNMRDLEQSVADEEGRAGPPDN